MDTVRENALKRARKCKGVTQEKAAEMSGYSVDAIQAWEAGTRRASPEVLNRMAMIYDAGWMPRMYLEEVSSGLLSPTIPDFRPGVPMPQAVMALVDKVMAFEDDQATRRLISMAADGTIDEAERPEYDRIMTKLEDICRTALEVKFAKEGS